MQFITQFGESRETDVMKRMPRSFVQRERVAAEEAAAKKSHARTQCRDVRGGENEQPARLECGTSRAETKNDFLNARFPRLKWSHQMSHLATGTPRPDSLSRRPGRDGFQLLHRHPRQPCQIPARSAPE